MQRVKTPDSKFKQLVSTAFPEYRGRIYYFDVVAPEREYNLDSYWSDGYRDYHIFISLEGNRTLPIPQNGTPFDGPLARGITHRIPDGYALLTHSYAGCRQYVKVTVNSNNAAQLLTA